VLVVTTPTVASLYGHDFASETEKVASRVDLLVLPCDEASKSLSLVEEVCEMAADLRLERRAILIALGGGICSDVVTLAASLIRRGITHVRVPTTLVGQVDASIGIKGAVNFRGKKSFLGAFHPPGDVFIDPDALATLPAEAIRDGIAEIAKIGLVRDPALFSLVANNPADLVETRLQSSGGRRIIELAVRAMLDELKPNLFENRSYKRLVDFGHTFSPALEASYGFQLSHGAAVAIDVAFSAAIAAESGLLSERDYDAIVSLFSAVGLPVYLPRLSLALCREALLDAARHRGGAVNLVVPTGVGRATFVEDADGLPDALLQLGLRRLRERSLSDGLGSVGA
jgi:3-dehydroquinate synthase